MSDLNSPSLQAYDSAKVFPDCGSQFSNHNSDIK